MTIKYQIFVSSTYKDLKDERNEIIKACLNMDHIPVGMEMFNAADEEQWAVITRTIGLARATTKIGLANLVHNMRRLIWLERQPALA